MARHSSVISSAGALGLARLASIVSNLVMIPIALDYLGDARFGLWMAIASFLMMLGGLADGGVSHGLISVTAREKAKGNISALSVVLSTGLIMVTGFAVVLGGLLFGLTQLINWGTLLELQEGATAQDATLVFVIAIVAFTLTMPVNVMLKFRTGLSRIIGVGLLDAAAFAAVIPALLIVRALDWGFGPFVAAALLTPVVVKAIGSLFFLWQDRTYSVSTRNFHANRGRELLGAGLVFFFISITQVIAINADQLLIGIFSDISQVTPYAIFAKLFILPYTGINLVLVVLWPRFTERHAQGDTDWVRRVFRQTLVAAVIAGIAAGLLLYAVQEHILRLWIGRDFNTFPLLIQGMALYTPAVIVVGVISTLLVSLSVFRAQIYMNLAMMAVNLPLSIYLIGEWGAAGAIWATVVAYILCICLPGMFVVRHTLGSAVAKAKP